MRYYGKQLGENIGIFSDVEGTDPHTAKNVNDGCETTKNKERANDT